MTKLSPKSLLVAAAATFIVVLAANPALARVSLASLDAKLDLILGALGGSMGSINVDFINERAARLIDSDGDGERTQHLVFTVPDGKILVVDHASILLDVVVQDRPADMRIEGQLLGQGVPGPGALIVPLGYMDEYIRTSRGTPNFLVTRNVSTYFGAGSIQCIGETNFGGVNLRFGIIECTISGRLIDAP